MKVILRADGTGSTLIQNNERGADTLDPYTRSVKELSSKRNRTDADNLELGHREFLCSLYTNGNGPCIPSFNVVRCLQDAAKMHKRGRDVERGVLPITEEVDVLYDGPRDVEKLWKEGTFMLRKGVVVSGRRIIKTRPMFKDFAFEVPVEVDPRIFDLDTIKMIWGEAGKYTGIGDFRPISGRFVGTALSTDEWLKHADGDKDSIWTTNQTAIRRVIAEDIGRKAKHTK